MQAFQRWRSILILKKTFTQSATAAAANSASRLASFHSTTALYDKWNNFNYDVQRDKKQPKAPTIRYEVREKRALRAGVKKALNNIVFNGGRSTSKIEKIEADYTQRLNKKLKTDRGHQSKNGPHRKMKRNHRRKNPHEDSDFDPERIFYATFAEEGFKTSRKGFDWTVNSGRNNRRFDEQNAKTRTESHPIFVGTYAERQILGLPTTGPLIIDDVKAAFRSSALKWHPDKHQGSSQAAAEEKFKDCVNAYNSLCNVLSSP